METLRRAATSAHAPRDVALHGIHHPDTVTLCCMLAELPWTVTPQRPADDGAPPDPGMTWLRVAPDEPRNGTAPASRDGATSAPEVLTVPTAAGQLDRRALRPLTAEDLDPSASPHWISSTGRLGLPDLRSQAVALAQRLDGLLRTAPERRGWRRLLASTASTSRPVICLSPHLDTSTLLAVAWAALLIDGVCVLEPQWDAFIPTLQWVRPTVVVGTDAEESDVHRTLVATPRRHRRLRAWLSASATAGSPLDDVADLPVLDPQLWDALGVRRWSLPGS